MMFHRRDQDFVAGADVLAAVGLRHQVDALRRTANIDDFARLSSVHEPLELDPRILIGLRGALAEQVNATMDIGAVNQVIVQQGVDDRLRLLAGCRIVKIDQRFAVHLLLENGKVLADFPHIESRACSSTTAGLTISRVVAMKPPAMGDLRLVIGD